MGGDRRRCVVRPGAGGRLGVVRFGPGDAAAFMCAAGPEQAMSDASLRVAPEPPWSVWRDQALCGARGASARRRRRPGRALFASRRPRQPSYGNADMRHPERVRARFAGHGPGRWPEAAEHVEVALAAIDEHRMYDYAAGLLGLVGAARLAVHRGDLDEANRQLTRAMRARPSCTFAMPFLAVRAGCSWPRCTGPWPSRRPPTTSCARSTTSCSTARPSASSWTRSPSFAACSAPARRWARPAGRRSPRRSSGCCRTCRRTSRCARWPTGCTCPATRSAPRSARSIASWASRHAARRWSRRPRSDCSAVAEIVIGRAKD